MSVFVHSWFRSSSTWLWAKFRASPSLRAYYEPLNEELPLWTPELIRSRPAAAFEGDRHPALDRHYFYEYIDIIAAKRLNFRPDLSYQRYLLQPSEPDEALRLYLEGLIADAKAAGRRPVLCFCRSQMRSMWMSARFGGLHIGQIRNPWDQWRSFGAHPYFHRKAVKTALILNHLAAGSFAHVQQIAAYSGNGKGQHFDYPSIRKCFALIWLASTLQALAASELIVDTELIAGSSQMRRELENELASRGLPLDFSDCRPTVGASLGASPLDADLQEAAAAILSHAGGLLPFSLDMVGARQLRCVAPRTAALLVGVLERSGTDPQAIAG